MKVEEYMSLTWEQREYWNFKFKDKVKFPKVNLILVSLTFALYAICSLASIIFLSQEYFNLEYANTYVFYLQPLTIGMFFIWFIDVGGDLIAFFIWRHREKKWLEGLEDE